MGLLGKFFKGSPERDENIGSRSKRGRAPSIRTPLDSAPPGGAQPGLPEINLDDLEKPRASAAPAAGAKHEAAATLDPMTKAAKPPEKPPIDLDIAPAKPAARPAAPAKPAAPAPAAAPRAEKAPASVGASAGGDAAVKRTSRLQSRQKPIGELLIQTGSVSTEQLSRALKIQDKGGKGLVGQILVGMGACQHAAILAALNRQFRISTVELDRVEIPVALLSLVPLEKCREHRLVPFEKLPATLCISMANCLNRKAINEVEELTKLKVKPFNSTWIEIRKVIEAAAKMPAVATGAAGEVKAAAAAPALADDSPTRKAPAVEVPPAAEKTAPAAPAAKAAPAAEAEPAPAAAAAEASEAERRPFTGPARARIEGLDTLDSAEAEVVQETERGLASKHLEAIQRRRAERQKIMGTGKGVVGRLVAPGLDAYRPEGAPDEETEEPAGAGKLVPLRLVEDNLLLGANLPIAQQLAANLEAFLAPPAEAAPPEPEPAPAPEPEPTPAPEPEPTPAPRAAEPVPEAEPAAAELPAVPVISFKPVEEKELEPIPISDAEWAAMEADLEPDPVVAWQATYASAGPVPAAQSWL